MFASNADPKSKEKWWIFYFRERRMRFISQFIMSCSKKVGITVYLTEHF